MYPQSRYPNSGYSPNGPAYGPSAYAPPRFENYGGYEASPQRDLYRSRDPYERDGFARDPYARDALHGFDRHDPHGRDSYGHDRYSQGYDPREESRRDEHISRRGEQMTPYRQFEMFSRPKLPKLYVAKISANCLGPWLLLKEACIPFELVEVDLAKGDNHTSEFLAMNPMGQVPTYVETDGTVIWESNAIMRFICEKHAVPKHFYPKDVNLRGRIEMALDWRQTVLYPNVSKVCYPSLGFTKDRSRVAEGRDSLDKDLRVLSDFFLRETPFIGGALPCIADYALALPLLYLYATDFRIPPKIREYLENLAGKTPAWNEVTEDLKQFISKL